MTVSNTVCAYVGCGESAEHPMHHGEDKIHDYVPGEAPPGGFTMAQAERAAAAYNSNLRLHRRSEPIRGAGHPPRRTDQGNQQQGERMSEPTTRRNGLMATTPREFETEESLIPTDRAARRRQAREQAKR